MEGQATLTVLARRQPHPAPLPTLSSAADSSSPEATGSFNFCVKMTTGLGDGPRGGNGGHVYTNGESMSYRPSSTETQRTLSGGGNAALHVIDQGSMINPRSLAPSSGLLVKQYSCLYLG